MSDIEARQCEADQCRRNAEISLNAANQRAAKSQLEIDHLNNMTRCLKQGVELFQDPSSRVPYKYPVMQLNGHCMDLQNIIAIWAKTAPEGDNHPYRSYICPLTRTPTSLVHLKVNSRLQAHANALGVQLLPPMFFEIKRDGQWTPFTFTNQFYLIAQVSFIHANIKHERNDSDIIVLDEGGNTFIRFQLVKVCMDLSAVRRPLIACKQAAQSTLFIYARGAQDCVETAVRMRIAESWNPFPELIVADA